jgi:PAS domain S-box-containing protein
MDRKKKTQGKAADELADLKNRLTETEETLHAIRRYLVDAFVVTRENGAQVVTLSDASFPYRMMVESMNEGAVTLIPDGTIFYCNPRFNEMVKVDGEKLIGVQFRDLILPEEQDAFDAVFRHAGHNGLRGEFCLRAAEGACVPVQLSVYRLSTEEVSGVAILATDVSERRQAEEKIRALASELTIVEQKERHRISQILHDDLQQRLFAIRAQLAFLMDKSGNGSSSSELAVTVDQIQSWLSEAITITRNLSNNLSPVVLQGEGLSEALAWLASQMKEQYGMKIEVAAADDFGQLDEHMRVMLFQAVRELLFNVVKHAGTQHAKVHLSRENGTGRITVSDSGDGFDAAAIMSDPLAAHGLLILQDRLSLLGCNMEIRSSPGNGTIVVIDLPEDNFSVS